MEVTHFSSDLAVQERPIQIIEMLGLALGGETDNVNARQARVIKKLNRGIN